MPAPQFSWSAYATSDELDSFAQQIAAKAASGRSQAQADGPAPTRADHYPRFSPDGQTVAFVRHSMVYTSEVYLVPASGGEPRILVTDKGFTHGLDWTRDGREEDGEPLTLPNGSVKS